MKIKKNVIGPNRSEEVLDQNVRKKTRLEELS